MYLLNSSSRGPSGQNTNSKAKIKTKIVTGKRTFNSILKTNVTVTMSSSMVLSQNYSHVLYIIDTHFISNIP